MDGSGGFLGCCGDLSIEFEVGIEDDLVIDLGFSEHDVPFMTFLLPVFGGLAEGNDRVLTALRFEANFGAALFGP
jgi:hypothetical protein